MDKLENIEYHLKGEIEWHTNKIRYYREQARIARDIVAALPECDIKFEMRFGYESIGLKFENEIEAREGRELVTNAIPEIVEWDKDFDTSEMTEDEPKWRWVTEIKIEGAVMYIYVSPTNPKPDCVPALKVRHSTYKSWTCERREQE